MTETVPTLYNSEPAASLQAHFPHPVGLIREWWKPLQLVASLRGAVNTRVVSICNNENEAPYSCELSATVALNERPIERQHAHIVGPAANRLSLGASMIIKGLKQETMGTGLNCLEPCIIPFVLSRIRAASSQSSYWWSSSPSSSSVKGCAH